MVAIDSDKSLIDAHKTGLSRRNGHIVNFFPKEHRVLVAQIRRRIARWEKLYVELKK